MSLVNTKKISIGLIILFHAVGLAGFFIPSLQPFFLKLVPYHLLLMLLIVGYNYDGRHSKAALFAAIIFISGYTAEWLGVNTHKLFGNYVYGPVLGYKVSNIPLMIGVNWLMLVYATGCLMQRSRLPFAFRVMLGALLMVLLDVFIEPVAVRFNYWQWLDAGQLLVAPMKNYFDWFWLSVLMLFLFELFKFKKQNVVGLSLLFAQFAFFIVMQLCLK